MDEDFAVRLPKYPVPETHGEPASEIEELPRSGGGTYAAIVVLRVFGVMCLVTSPILGCGWLACGVPVLLLLAVVMVARGEQH